jgi:hypothetical protein
MAMVVSIEQCEDIFSRAVVTLLEEGKLLREGTWGHSNEWDASECQFGNGRYKAVAV